MPRFHPHHLVVGILLIAAVANAGLAADGLDNWFVIFGSAPAVDEAGTQMLLGLAGVASAIVAVVLVLLSGDPQSKRQRRSSWISTVATVAFTGAAILARVDYVAAIDDGERRAEAANARLAEDRRFAPEKVEFVTYLHPDSADVRMLGIDSVVSDLPSSYGRDDLIRQIPFGNSYDVCARVECVQTAETALGRPLMRATHERGTVSYQLRLDDSLLQLEGLPKTTTDAFAAQRLSELEPVAR